MYIMYGCQTCSEMAEKGSPACAASVGCSLLQAVMSTSKGGSENVCVNYDTSTALALAGLDAVLHTCTGAVIFAGLFGAAASDFLSARLRRC